MLDHSSNAIESVYMLGITRTYSRQRSEKDNELASGQFFDHNVKETLLKITTSAIYFFFSL
jgi:hypothetical protein